MRIIHTLLLALLLAAPVATFAAEGSASVHAILIAASAEKGPSDPKLAPYEPTLRRVLRFERFRYLGEGSATVSGGGTATLSLAGGQQIELEGEKAGATVRVKVRWQGNLIAVPPGKPVVLGGQPWGDKGEVSAIIITAN